jgi:hypothetical protein
VSTGELERLERLLERALHEADQVPVDLRAARASLGPRLDQRQRSVRRRTVIAAAASVLAVVLTTSIVFAGLREDKESLPPAGPAPGITLSPSGLPVGLLVGRVDRTEPGAKSTIRIVVRPDGTGTWNSGTTGDSTGNSVSDHPVRLDRAGPGLADIVNTDEDLWCETQRLLSLEFTLRDRTVVIEDVNTGACVVVGGLGSDMSGTTLRILPLPRGP